MRPTWLLAIEKVLPQVGLVAVENLVDLVEGLGVLELEHLEEVAGNSLEAVDEHVVGCAVGSVGGQQWTRLGMHRVQVLADDDGLVDDVAVGDLQTRVIDLQAELVEVGAEPGGAFLRVDVDRLVGDLLGRQDEAHALRVRAEAHAVQAGHACFQRREL